jgi:phospholipid/cholesterol/gamma-HCH transport system substrate-binding protein
MENRAYALAAGSFVAIVVALFIAGSLWLSGRTGEGVPYVVVSERSVGGLLPGAIVRLRGVKVGQVASIGFDPTDSRRIFVPIVVDSGIGLTQDTYAKLTFTGVSGVASIELDDDRTTRTVLLSSAENPARIPLRSSWLSDLSDSSAALMNSATQTSQRLDKLLSDQNMDHLSRLLAQLDDASVQISGLATELRPTVRRVDRLVADSQETVRSLRPAIRNLDSLISDTRSRIDMLDALREGAQELRRTARNLDQALAHDTLPQMSEFARRLSRSADRFDEVLQQIKEQPQSLLYGPAPGRPGPGEPGFQPVRGAPR